jgi:hypothetical protein
MEKDTVVYRLYDIIIPKQTVGAADVETSDNQQFELLQLLREQNSDLKVVNEILQSMTMWCHSHVNMGIGPSGTDNATFKKFIKLDQDSNIQRVQAMMIFNKRDEAFTRVYDPFLNVLWENIPLEVDQPSVSFGDIDQIITERVNRRTFTSTKTNGAWPDLADYYTNPVLRNGYVKKHNSNTVPKLIASTSNALPLEQRIVNLDKTSKRYMFSFISLVRVALTEPDEPLLKDNSRYTFSHALQASNVFADNELDWALLEALREVKEQYKRDRAIQCITRMLVMLENDLNVNDLAASARREIETLVAGKPAQKKKSTAIPATPALSPEDQNLIYAVADKYPTFPTDTQKSKAITLINKKMDAAGFTDVHYFILNSILGPVDEIMDLQVIDWTTEWDEYDDKDMTKLFFDNLENVYLEMLTPDDIVRAVQLTIKFWDDLITNNSARKSDIIKELLEFANNQQLPDAWGTP